MKKRGPVAQVLDLHLNLYLNLVQNLSKQDSCVYMKVTLTLTLTQTVYVKKKFILNMYTTSWQNEQECLGCSDFRAKFQNLKI